MAENVARDLEGAWLAVSSNNIDNYLLAMGVGKYQRHQFSKDTVWQKIRVIGDVIHLEMCCPGTRHVAMQFRLDEPFEIRAGKCSKAEATWKNGALVIDCVRLETGYRQILERRRVGDRMIQKMVHKDVTCSRTFVRVKESDLNEKCDEEKD